MPEDGMVFMVFCSLSSPRGLFFFSHPNLVDKRGPQNLNKNKPFAPIGRESACFLYDFESGQLEEREGNGVYELPEEGV
jgi:hypothetical protein